MSNKKLNEAAQSVRYYLGAISRDLGTLTKGHTLRCRCRWCGLSILAYREVTAREDERSRPLFERAEPVVAWRCRGEMISDVYDEESPTTDADRE